MEDNDLETYIRDDDQLESHLNVLQDSLRNNVLASSDENIEEAEKLDALADDLSTLARWRKEDNEKRPDSKTSHLEDKLLATAEAAHQRASVTRKAPENRTLEERLYPGLNKGKRWENRT